MATCIFEIFLADSCKLILADFGSLSSGVFRDYVVHSMEFQIWHLAGLLQPFLNNCVFSSTAGIEPPISGRIFTFIKMLLVE